MLSRYIKRDYISFIVLVNGTQACANFRPGYARYIIEKYGVDFDLFLDPCMGFGGRMVGFFASKYKIYIATDPATKTYKANCRMRDILLPREKEAILFNQPFEELDLSKYNGKVDIVFTSPPYFNKEIYADEETQSAIKFSEYEDWKSGFLLPLCQKSYAALKNDRYMILNIEDINIGKERFDLVNDTIIAAQQAGFDFIERDEFTLQTRTMLIDGEKSTQDGKESVLVFKKK